MWETHIPKPRCYIKLLLMYGKFWKTLPLTGSGVLFNGNRLCDT